MENSTGNDYNNDIEVLRKMEDEHCRLQRQFRTIQTDRLQRAMGVHPQFRRQDQLMQTLKKEYLNILKDLKIAKSGMHKSKRARLESDLKKAILLRMQTAMECDEGLTVMEQLDGVLQRNSKEMQMLRKMNNANMGQILLRQEQSETRLVSTENKLEVAKLRFNAIQWENSKIREEIEHMLKDRAAFNQAWSKMMTAINKGKKFLADLFESSTLAYDQRDELCAKLRSVQEKAKMDQMQQLQEMRDHQKAFDHEMKLFHFLARKGVMRINTKQEEREEDQKKKATEAIQQQYAAHMTILDDIYEYAKEDDFKKIIANFERVEHSNFSIYILLTTYCAENVVLAKNLATIRQQVEDRSDWNDKKDLERKKCIQKLTQQLEEKKTNTEKLRYRLTDQEQMLTGVMEEIGVIFRMLDCSLEPFQNLLGDKQPSLYQFKLTLQIIADKIKEHVETVYYYEHCIQKKAKSSTSRLKKYTVQPKLPEYWSPSSIDILVPATPCPACVETRWISRVSESLESPFDRQMARAALQTLIEEPAYLRSDRVHQLTECRVPISRAILARRYMTH
ncbi:hypothetical protein evm_013189 [Chilo suppressalis]|nr:hypothetical protein evm_013189 [Chilo suppressalis]